MQKGEWRRTWFETRLPRIVISAYHLPIVGGARRRKLPLGSYVNKPLSRNLSRKSTSKECQVNLSWFPIFFCLIVTCNHCVECPVLCLLKNESAVSQSETQAQIGPFSPPFKLIKNWLFQKEVKSTNLGLPLEGDQAASRLVLFWIILLEKTCETKSVAEA